MPFQAITASSGLTTSITYRREVGESCTAFLYGENLAETPGLKQSSALAGSVLSFIDEPLKTR